METESDVDAELSAGSGLFKGVGITLIVLGVLAILLPAVAAFSVVLFAAWVLIISSLFIFGSAFAIDRGGDMIVRMLWAAVALIAGIILLVNPDASIGFMTAILAIYFILMGLVKLVVAVGQRGQPGIGWVAVSGVLSLVIGLIIIVDIQNTKDWAIGLLLGIDFIFAGFVLLMAGSSLKQLDSGT